MFCFNKLLTFQIIKKYVTYLGFNSYIISYNFVLYAMYITPHLHVVKGFWKFEILKHFEFLQISNLLTFYF